MINIYKASAGSGKTFSLTVEYVTLLIKNPRHYKNILATTFTIKAAAEMKERIISLLNSLSKGDTSKLDELAAIKQKIPHFSDSQIQSNAEIALKNILFDYSAFQISTIDSFFVNIIRSSAKELGIDIGFDIELDINKIKKFILLNIYKIDDPVIQGVIKDIMEQNLNDGENGKIDGYISNTIHQLENVQANFLFSAENGFNISEIQSTIESIRAKIDKFEKEVTQLAQEALDIIASTGKNIEDFGKFKLPSLKNIIDGKFVITQTFKDLELVVFSDNKCKYYYGLKEKKDEFNRIADESNLHDKVVEIINKFEKEETDYLTAKAIIENYNIVILFQHVRKLLEIFNQETGKWTLFQLMQQLSSIVQETDAPILYEKVGSRYKYIFIDEFQDTSILQWNAMKPLIIESIAQGGQVFIFGDVKQSIYRWRNGRMKLLLNEVEEQFLNQTQVIKLSDNWRSAANIVNWNNQLFSSIVPLLIQKNKFKDQNLQKLFDDVHQNAQSKKEGYVLVKEIPNKKNKEDNKKNEENQDFDSVVAKDIIEQIEAALKRNYQLSDMMILVRENKSAEKIIEALHEKGIAYTTKSSQMLKDIETVQAVMQTLYYVYNPKDSASLWNASMIANQRELNQALDAFKKFQETEWNGALLSTLFHSIIDFWNFKLDNDEGLQFLLTWINNIHGNNTTLHDVITLWDAEKDTLRFNTPTKNGIEIMTIFAAKGLERDIVFLPNLNFQATPKINNSFWTKPPNEFESLQLIPLIGKADLKKTKFASSYEEEIDETIAEALNILYVGCTRAVREMYLYFEVTEEKKEKTEKEKSTLSINKILKDALDKHEIPTELGEKTTKIVTVAQENTAGSTIDIQHPDKKNQTIEVKNIAKRMFELTPTGEKIQSGIWIHYYFYQYARTNDKDRAIQNTVKKHLLSEEEEKWLHERSDELWNKIPQLSTWYSGEWQLITEQSIVVNGEKMTPDLIVHNGHNTILIDFKRDVFQPSYERQLKRYAKALTAMNYPVTEAYLLFTETATLQSIEL